MPKFKFCIEPNLTITFWISIASNFVCTDQLSWKFLIEAHCLPIDPLRPTLSQLECTLKANLAQYKRERLCLRWKTKQATKLILQSSDSFLCGILTYWLAWLGSFDVYNFHNRCDTENLCSLQGRCNREKPPCKYFHPPQHLKDQLLINGRNHLALKNALMQQMGLAPGQTLVPGQMPASAVVSLVSWRPFLLYFFLHTMTWNGFCVVCRL